MRWLAFAFLVLSLPAHAASFDCKLAKSIRERAICADPELSKADEALSAAYAAAQQKASVPYRAELLTQQRQWLRQTDLVCTSKRTDIASDDLRGCLNADITNRTTFLRDRAISKIGPLRVVQHMRMSAQLDPDATEGIWRFGTHEQEWPQIEAPAIPQTAALNAWITTNLATPSADADDPSQDYEITVMLREATPEVVQITDSVWSYGHGAAHGNYGSSNITWLLAEQRELRASDVFAAPNWQAALAGFVVKGFMLEHDGEKPWTEPADLQKMVESPRRWSFSAKGLQLMFDPYEVASYAEGEVFIDISWHDLAPLLAKDSKVLAMLRR